MQLLLRHKLLIGGATLAMAATGGAAYAATQSGSNGQQAFLNDAAKRLNVSPTELRSALKSALIDRLNAEVKAGRLTQAQANKIEQRIEQSGRLPFFLAPGGHRFFGGRVRGAGVFHAAATYLGVTNRQLLSDLRSGKSLAQIAKAHGKSVPGLEQAITTAEKTRLNRAVSNGKITAAQEQQLLNRLSAKISRLVNRTGIGRHAGEGPGFRGAPGGQAPNEQLPPKGAFFPGGGPGDPGAGPSGAPAVGPGAPAPGPGALGPNA